MARVPMTRSARRGLVDNNGFAKGKSPDQLRADRDYNGFYIWAMETEKDVGRKWLEEYEEARKDNFPKGTPYWVSLMWAVKCQAIKDYLEDFPPIPDDEIKDKITAGIDSEYAPLTTEQTLEEGKFNYAGKPDFVEPEVTA